MIQTGTGFESRVKVQQILENQLPLYIQSEYPNVSEFLKQYYISQEYQGGPVDIAENLDQYLKLDKLTPDVIVDSTVTESSIDSSSSTISVNSTKGFPDQYGLLKIDDEIITYTGITTNSFTGCIRGFSGITSYRDNLNNGELVFTETSKASHSSGSSVKNLSSLFLKEFYTKLKSTFAPGLENVDFDSQVDAGNFLRGARSFYQSKGTNESFRILFNILYGVTPKIINLEDFLFKSSSANYLKREIVIIDVISGDPQKLFGQTIAKSTDSSNTFATVSSVEPFTRNNNQFFKLELFVGYNDFPAIEGNFVVTPSTKCLETVSIGSSYISVDSTIGFSTAGSIVSGNDTITYTSKSVNQFYGCQGVNSEITTSSIIRSEDTYFGYEDGDITNKVEFLILGSISNFVTFNPAFNIFEGDPIRVKNLGKIVDNNDANYEQILTNSWIYNVSPRFRISISSTPTSDLSLDDNVGNKLRKGDEVEIIKRGSQEVVLTTYINQDTVSNSNQINIAESYNFSLDLEYDLRRKIRKSNSVSLDSNNLDNRIKFSHGDNSIVSDIQNVYIDGDDFVYVASNSLPSTTRGIDQKFPYSYDITKNIKSIQSNQLVKTGTKFDIIEFSSKVPFVTGDKVLYTQGSENPISGLFNGTYYIEKISDTRIKIYGSRSFIGTSNFVTFDQVTSNAEGNTFTLFSHRDLEIGPQKLLKKFPLSVDTKNSTPSLTNPGPIGMLVNGVEVVNYKSSDKMYYGPLKSISLLNGGSNYDVINLPNVKVSSGSGTDALVQPVISGSVTDVVMDPTSIDFGDVISVEISGGNGKGANIFPIVVEEQREIFFDARTFENSGGISTASNTITFLTDHNLLRGDQIIYDNNENLSIGIGTGKPIQNKTDFFVNIVNAKTIQLFNTKNDSSSGINTVGLTTINALGVHRFFTAEKRKRITEFKVLNGGSGYTNRKLIVNPSGISTVSNTITFENHNFNNGDLIEYTYQTSSISGLSTDNKYYVLKVDDNTFKLCNAGIGGTSNSDFENQKYALLSTTGSGYQYFKYPDITAKLKFNPVGTGLTQTIDLIPTVRGPIVDSYLYEKGTGYGSTIINHEKNPIIEIENGTSAAFIPNIINGTIESVTIESGGREYYSTPDLIVHDPTGKGSGSKLRPVINNGRITEVKVINAGIGYSSTSVVKVIPTGQGVLYSTNIRDLTLINNNKYDKNENELILESENKLQYAVCGYSTDFFNLNESEGSHSKIIGWAYDGNPIYGPYGNDNPSVNDPSTTRIMKSGYVLDISNVFDRPSGITTGLFVEDYKFNDSGDLDESNGRFSKTPQFPNGVYAYYATYDPLSKKSLFPYFVGNKYKSEPVEDNFLIDQSFDFINSNLVRNTNYYNIDDKNVDYDFVFESANLSSHLLSVESTNFGEIESFDIVSKGDNYEVDDVIKFDNTDAGTGAIVKVSEIEGKSIEEVSTSTLSINNSVFVWNNNNQVQVYTLPKHDFVNGDEVVISGFSTESKLNDKFKITVDSKKSSLIQSISATSVGSTEIYVSDIPQNVRVGSNIGIGTETLTVLDIERDLNILRVKRGVEVGHSTSSTVTFFPDTFLVDIEIPKFNSRPNDKIYINPTESIGVGTTAGITTSVSLTYGSSDIVRQIPTQAIFIKNHPFKNNQKVTFTIVDPSVNPSGISTLSISTTSSSPTFDLPPIGMGVTDVYVTNKGRDFIGIKTTLDSDEVFFHTNGIDNDEYLLETNYSTRLGKVEKTTTTVSVSTSHGLESGDIITLSIQPNLNVGIGTSSQVYLLKSDYFGLVTKRVNFVNANLDLENNSISISGHGFKTGDKVGYDKEISSETDIGGLTEYNSYYIFKVDENNIKLCETYLNSKKKSPITISLTSNGGSSDHYLNLINSRIEVDKGNNLVFNLENSSLSGYELKIFSDINFENEFVSTGSTNSFNVITTGTPGSSNSNLTINYSDNIPQKLYYSLAKSGYISTADVEVDNYSQILYQDNIYSGEYSVTGIGTTTFSVNLKESPIKTSYTQSDCDILKYETSSKSANGPISKLKFVSSGSGYFKLPSVKEIVTSKGNGASIRAKSSNIGNINSIRFVNNIFNYPSDNTLRPTASLPSLSVLDDNNTIGFVTVSNPGSNYISAPSLVIVDSKENTKIDSGLLSANLNNSSIGSVDIVSNPVSLPNSGVTIFTTNNTNGTSILKVESGNTGIFTCILTTPAAGFNTDPFSANELVFIEGIKKSSTSGSGFNSEDYGFKFLKVQDYSGPPSNNNVNPARLTIDVSEYTTDTGIAVVNQNSKSTVVKESYYPKFDVTLEKSKFILDENLIIDGEERDIKITYTDGFFIKTSGTYELSVNDIIIGSQSNSKATISELIKNEGLFKVNYSGEKSVGWSNDIGTLSIDTQRLPDNDYYQNLSYSIKSPIEHKKSISSVNNLLHTAGMKNFSDTEIIGVANTEAYSGTTSTDVTTTFVDIIDEVRTDTLYNFDLARDIEVENNVSNFIEFSNKKLTKYTEIQSNLVLEIDDINSQFSNLSDQDNLLPYLNLVKFSKTELFSNFIIKITDSTNNEVQINDIIILSNGINNFLLEKGESHNSLTTSYGTFSIEPSETNTSISFLRFTPNEVYEKDYNIKILERSFTNDEVGVGTNSIGFIDLISSTKNVDLVGITTFISIDKTEIDSLLVNVQCINDITKEMNFVEMYITHDGTNTYLSESYFDSDDSLFNSQSLVSFASTISSNNLEVWVTNNSTSDIKLKSRIVGFTPTTNGSGSYKFKSSSQPDSSARNVEYTSEFVGYNIGPQIDVVGITSLLFDANKTIVQISNGTVKTIHQLMVTQNDGVVIEQSKFITANPTDPEEYDSTLGIGTFGGRYDGNEYVITLYLNIEFQNQGSLVVSSFNEKFYTLSDSNTADSLSYGNVLETIRNETYYGHNSDVINKTEFTLKSNDIDIFGKTFNPSVDVDLNTGIFTIQNHLFKNNEQLIYTPKSSFIGIGSTPMMYRNDAVNVEAELPSTVFAIVNNNDSFQISTTKSGTPVTFTSVGEGNAHEFEMFKKNEKTIITVDGMVQSPIAYTPIGYQLQTETGGINDSDTLFSLSGISSIRLNDALKIDDEYMKVVAVGFGTTTSGPISGVGTFGLVDVERGFLGSTANNHTDTTESRVYRGSYNIVGKNIYFAEAPRGSFLEERDSGNLEISTSDFYGRVFLKNNYDNNKVYDDISDQFTGIGRTFTITVGGANTSGIGSTGGNGLMFINGFFQSPTTPNNSNNNFTIEEDTTTPPGISTVIFSGRLDNGVAIAHTDINMNEVPRGGIIVSYGFTGGLGYAPLVGASITSVINGSGEIQPVGLGTTDFTGSGYNGDPSGIGVSVFDPDGTGNGAQISVSAIGIGGSLTFNVDSAGTNYSSNTRIFVDSPSYENLDIIGISRIGVGETTEVGEGLRVDVSVSASSTTTGIGSTFYQVSDLQISRPGYGFQIGDKFEVVGLTTDANLENSGPLEPFVVEVLDVFNDSFSLWEFGNMDYIDSIKPFQNGTRTNFTLYYDDEILSFESPDGVNIDFANLLLIFVNGILQKPGESYTFGGGTSFDFTEAPKTDDKVDIFFYRGVGGVDSTNVNIVPKIIEEGDEVQIVNSVIVPNSISQEKRTVMDIAFSDRVETNLYYGNGITNTPLPINIIKQKSDKIIGGKIQYKTRDSIKSQVYPSAKVIKNVGLSTNIIYVDNSELFLKDVNVGDEYSMMLVSVGSSDPVSAALTATLGNEGIISNITSTNNGGSGYITAPTISILPPPEIGIGIGTTATATATISNGSVNSITITNPGLGYTQVPQILVSVQNAQTEIVTGITSDNTKGFSGSVTGIGTTVVGSQLSIKFSLTSDEVSNFDSCDLQVGDAIFVYDTNVGLGVTSVDGSDSSIIGLGNTFCTNVYYIAEGPTGGATGVVTCNIHSETDYTGISSSGTEVGRYSWGRIESITRSSNPIQLTVTGNSVDVGLSTFPTTQRRGSTDGVNIIGLRDTGSLK